MNIYVGNLAYSVTEEDLREAFAAFGNPDRVNVIMDKFTGQSKGFGFVEMNDSDGEAAIAALNDSDLQGRRMRVNVAKPREQQRSNGGARRY
jgi:RNA recognition motif-containing protein